MAIDGKGNYKYKNGAEYIEYLLTKITGFGTFKYSDGRIDVGHLG